MDGYETQRQQTESLQKSYRDLEDKIRQARHKKTLLIARLARSESAQRINRALDRAEGQSAFAQFARLERKVDRSEARARPTTASKAARPNGWTPSRSTLLNIVTASTAARNDLDVWSYLKGVLDQILAGCTDWESLRADV